MIGSQNWSIFTKFVTNLCLQYFEQVPVNLFKNWPPFIASRIFVLCTNFCLQYFKQVPGNHFKNSVTFITVFVLFFAPFAIFRRNTNKQFQKLTTIYSRFFAFNFRRRKIIETANFWSIFFLMTIPLRIYFLIWLHHV